MSVIQGVITYYNAILISDGRLTGIDGKIKQEDLNKIRRINSYVLVAFAGNLGICEEILKKTISVLSDVENLKLDGYFNKFISTAAQYIGDIKDHIKLLESKNYNIISNFIIVGIRTNGKIGMITVDTKDIFNPINYTADEKNDCIYTVAASEDKYSELLKSNILNLFEDKSFLNINDIVDKMKESSKHLSTIDYTVNDSIYMDIIEL